MIATLIEPFATMSGSVSQQDELYIRTLNGRCIVQHKPRRQSSLQAQLREQFGRYYGTARKKVIVLYGIRFTHTESKNVLFLRFQIYE